MYDTQVPSVPVVPVMPVSPVSPVYPVPTDRIILTRLGTGASPRWTRGGFYELVMQHARNPGRSPILTG